MRSALLKFPATEKRHCFDLGLFCINIDLFANDADDYQYDEDDDDRRRWTTK